VDPRRDANRRAQLLGGLRRRGSAQGALSTAAIAAIWAFVLAEAAKGSSEDLRTISFGGAPFLLLAGLHSRTAAYMHCPGRLSLLPKPVRAQEHWRLASEQHRRALLWVPVLGITALLVGVAPHCSPIMTLSLVGSLLWLLLLAALTEPLIAGVSAWLGRRLPAESTGAELQRSLAAGWTAPEAAVHLYAPALGVALAVALAMPLQLALEIQGMTSAALPFAIVPLVIAGGLRLLAVRLYSTGIWEAVPRIHEISRTLAGAPQPIPAAIWTRRLPGLVRLDLLQLQRLGALLWLRLTALLGVAIWIAWTQIRSAPLLALAAVTVALWVGPLLALNRQRQLRARLLGALPIGAQARSGAPSLVILLLGALPPLLLLLAILFATSP